MYKEKFDELVNKNVITKEEQEKIYTQMYSNSDDKLLGCLDSKIEYKYYVGGDIFNDTLCDFVIKYCTPKLGMGNIDETFNIYGITICGISSGWKWFRKDTITQYDIKTGHKPIEDATNEELWKMLAMISLYWEGNYKEWYHKSENKSHLLDKFIGYCERNYFGYNKDGYTLNTIEQILDKIKVILKDNFNKDIDK